MASLFSQCWSAFALPKRAKVSQLESARMLSHEIGVIPAGVCLSEFLVVAVPSAIGQLPLSPAGHPHLLIARRAGLRGLF